MFSGGETSGLQAGQSSSWTLLLWSPAGGIDAVCGLTLSCWYMQGLPWKRRHLDGSRCCSEICIYLMEPFQMCNLPVPQALNHPHTIRDEDFWTERWQQAGRSLSFLVQRMQHPSIWPFCGSCSHMASSLHDRALRAQRSQISNIDFETFGHLQILWFIFYHLLWSVDDGIFKVWGTLFWNCWTSAHLFFWETLPLSLFNTHHITDLLSINLIIWSTFQHVSSSFLFSPSQPFWAHQI